MSFQRAANTQTGETALRGELWSPSGMEAVWKGNENGVALYVWLNCLLASERPRCCSPGLRFGHNENAKVGRVRTPWMTCTHTHTCPSACIILYGRCVPLRPNGLHAPTNGMDRRCDSRPRLANIYNIYRDRDITRCIVWHFGYHYLVIWCEFWLFLLWKAALKSNNAKCHFVLVKPKVPMIFFIKSLIVLILS